MKLPRVGELRQRDGGEEEKERVKESKISLSLPHKPDGGRSFRQASGSHRRAASWEI